MKRALPIGYDDYKEVIENGFYYVDKTLLIKDILDRRAKVNLFTRPRRFGKSLNISMLRYFFEQPQNGISNRKLFSGKKIEAEGEEYLQYQEQYPVIQISLKAGKQPEFAMAYDMIIEEIAAEYQRHSYILDSAALSEGEKKCYHDILLKKSDKAVNYRALKFLSDCLEKYFHKKVIILIDEYDVPLENAYYYGFYDEMAGFIRSVFESALKSNLSLEFAVITGCLRISKESIFTGLNNLRIYSIMSEAYGEYFGFTGQELDNILKEFNLTEKSDILKKWYDGYLFGGIAVYNPWSVINYIAELLVNHEALPAEYWSNTSSNSIVRDLLEHSNTDVRLELENLIAGGAIAKELHEEITYADIYESAENLWNFLLFTGYLKVTEVNMADDIRVATLKIPNTEVKNIYRNQIVNWARRDIEQRDLSALYQALLTGDAEGVENELAPLLANSISYMDSYENFYHGFLLGVLVYLDGYKVKSNREAGNGRFDISIESVDGRSNPVIIELKAAKRRSEMQEKALEALAQIADRQYDGQFIEDGYSQCVHIGIGFCKKMCRVECETLDIKITRNK